MEKIKCEACGREVAVKDSVMWYDSPTSEARCLCMACYYKELAEISDTSWTMARRTTDDNNADSNSQGMAGERKDADQQ